MKDSKKRDIPDYYNPSSRNFSEILEEARNIFEWRYDLPKFFKDITGNPPYPYQAKFLKKMEDLSNEYAIISAGRGTGKSESLAVLALWYIYVLPLTEPGVPMKVVILAGSEKQARIVYNYITSFIAGIPFLQKALAKDPTRDEILFIDGSWIRPLTASEKSIRGPHPDLLVIDEACEAKEDLLKAAFPMIGTSKYPRLILSSTPDKYFSLFVDVYTKKKSYPQFLRFNWSALDCPLISKSFLKSQKGLLDVGNYQVEYLGLPYSFVGKVFPLKKLKSCVKYRNLKESDGVKYAGVDWGHCLTGDNEVLTREGWKRLDILSKEEEILTYNRRGFLEYQKPNKLYKRESQRVCVHWSNRNLDILGTWKHVIPVLDRNKKNFHEHRIGENLTHHFLIRRALFKGMKPFKILGYNSEDFLELLGWYLSEGCVERNSRGYRIYIGQTKKRNRREIIELLLRMSLRPKKHKLSIRFSNKELFLYFKKLGKAKEKYIPRDIKNLDHSLLKFLFRTMMKGDGDKDGFRYNTFSKQLAEDFQEIVIKIGEKISYIEDRGEKGFRVHLLSRDSSPNKDHFSETICFGFFVGLEVPNEYVLIRRKTKPVIIHNFPSPTVLTIVEVFEDKKKKKSFTKVLFASPYLRQNFEEVLDKIELVARSYKVSAIYTDSNDIGENQRLANRGLPVYPIKFKSQKAAMISNLRALVENELIQIDGAKDYPLVAQMRDYRYDSKKGDDFVDCYDPKTEVLTKKGWKKITSLSLRDEIAVLKDSYLKYEKPTKLIEEDLKGKAIKLTGRELDLLVTPRHKLYAALSKGANSYRPFELIRAKKLIGKHFRVKKTAKWEGEERKEYIIPGLKKKRGFCIWEAKERKIPMSIWLRFLGFYLSEGNTTRNKISIAQKEGPKKEVMRKFLKKLPFKVKENPNEFYIYSKQLAEHLKPLGKSHSKFIPFEILQLNSKYLTYLLEALMLGDGSRNHYYTVSKRLADNIQELCLKIGLSAEIRVLREENTGYIRGRKIKGGRIYTVDIHIKGEPRVNHHPGKPNTSTLKEVPYSGKMYCLTVPSHIIYVRRNGHPIWSGNSLMLAVKGGRKVLPLKWNLKDFIVIRKRKLKMESPFSLKHQMSEKYIKPEEVVTEKEKEVWEEIARKKKTE